MLFSLENCGEGMEWHSDGAKGEFTMLLAVEDVTADMGAVRIVPRSHLQYVDGVGHEEVKFSFSINFHYFNFPFNSEHISKRNRQS